MNHVPNELYQKWRHSFEEDKDDIMVFRPEPFNFPPSRGRSGMEFRHDGTFIKTNIGSADVNEVSKGQWQMKNSHNLQVSVDEDKQNLEIIECENNILKVKSPSTNT
ncbi:hypothetical protein CPJCM30710_26460 [Clostridium polyendosporum]|uniref:Lipocalin-like domain-containing protein n=1 Tax=Clostridium polyendosporum TaxID=69208 RepID=A0A919S2E2_9CLOT|nr:lipocalin family protein [Clostridium polyendosporum]GIM29980.1 hypothetical protein CPJCM30710_26460 [Clostridium polyendosporum]